MTIFQIGSAKLRGDSAFAFADLPERSDRQALNRAKAIGGEAALEPLLAKMSPVWDFDAPRKIALATGWTHFLPLLPPIVSDKMWAVLGPFAGPTTWVELPSLRDPPSNTRWGWMKGIPRADALDHEKTVLNSFGELQTPVLRSDLADIPNFFIPTDGGGVFVSEKVKKAMSASGLTGFAFTKTAQS